MAEQIKKTPDEIEKIRREAEILGMGDIIRNAIIRLGSKAPTSMIGMLNLYVRQVHPSMKDSLDSNFPVSVMRMPNNPERSTADGGKYQLLAFHIGNAILAYYKAVGTVEVRPEFKRRVSHLLAIADAGMDVAKVEGSIREGFHLVVPDTKASPGKSLPPITGGGRNTTSPPRVP